LRPGGRIVCSGQHPQQAVGHRRIVCSDYTHSKLWGTGAKRVILEDLKSSTHSKLWGTGAKKILALRDLRRGMGGEKKVPVCQKKLLR